MTEDEAYTNSKKSLLQYLSGAKFATAVRTFLFFYSLVIFS